LKDEELSNTAGHEGKRDGNPPADNDSARSAAGVNVEEVSTFVMTGKAEECDIS
jgi:hypothetical protein